MKGEPVEIILFVFLCFVVLWLILRQPWRVDWGERLQSAAEKAAKDENMPDFAELIRLTEPAREDLTPELTDRAHFKVDFNGLSYRLTVFANGSLQDTDRLIESMRRARLPYVNVPKTHWT
jgi:hypothetical protein